MLLLEEEAPAGTAALLALGKDTEEAARRPDVARMALKMRACMVAAGWARLYLPTASKPGTHAAAEGSVSCSTQRRSACDPRQANKPHAQLLLTSHAVEQPWHAPVIESSKIHFPSVMSG